MNREGFVHEEMVEGIIGLACVHCLTRPLNGGS